MLKNEFVSLCKAFAQKNGAFSENIEDNKNICKYKIELHSFFIEFRYVKKGTVFYKPSSLYCVIYLSKNSVVYYHLTDIIPFLKNKNFKSCYFWHIESQEKLKRCFEQLALITENIIGELSDSLSDYSWISKALFESYKNFCNLKDTDIDFSKIEDDEEFSHAYFKSLQKHRDGFVFARYSNFAPYLLLLDNKFEKALKKYEELDSKNNLFEYEKQLIKYVKGQENKTFLPFDSGCMPLDAKKLLGFSAEIKSFFCVFLIASVLFCLAWAINNYVISVDTILVLSAPWYMGLMCAALCSVFGAIAFASYMPHKYLTRAERKAYSKVLVSEGAKKVCFIAFGASVLAAIFLFVMITSANVRFYSEKITFDSQVYAYDSIDSVYYISARYNIYGDRIERDSYVILFKDKTFLDLDGYTSVEFTEKEVLPLLKEREIPILSVDSEKDLPGYRFQGQK